MLTVMLGGDLVVALGLGLGLGITWGVDPNTSPSPSPSPNPSSNRSPNPNFKHTEHTSAFRTSSRSATPDTLALFHAASLEPLNRYDDTFSFLPPSRSEHGVLYPNPNPKD